MLCKVAKIGGFAVLVAIALPVAFYLGLAILALLGRIDGSNGYDEFDSED